MYKEFINNIKHLYSECGPVLGTFIVVLNVSLLIGMGILFVSLFGTVAGLLTTAAIFGLAVLFAPLEMQCMEDRAKANKKCCGHCESTGPK